MSVKATTYVWEHSPFTGQTFIVHLAIADIVNDLHDNRLFMGDERLAIKARTTQRTVRRARAEMVEHGYLEPLTTRTHPGRPAEYRFLMPQGTVDISSAISDTPDGTTATGTADGSSEMADKPSTLVLIPTQGTQGGEHNVAADAARLCEALADRITMYRGDPSRRPKITKDWVKDMDLLIRRGPPSWEEPRAINPAVIEKAIAFVFDKCAEPRGSGNFCWAANIQSPRKLREKWEQLADEARRQRGTKRGPGTREKVTELRRRGA